MRNGRELLVGLLRGELAEKVMQGVRAGLFTELFRRAISNNLALINNDGSAACGVHFLENVGGEKNGLGLTEAFDELTDLVFLIGIESVGGFVEYQDIRVVQQGLGEAGTVTVSFGQSADGLMVNILKKAGLYGG